MRGSKTKYTFKQWCDDNNRQDLLDRWDYDKTGFSPEDITYSSAKPVYFKCPLGIHESEKRRVFSVTGNTDQNNFVCKECSKGRPPRFDDLSGRKFGKITVLCPDDERNKNRPKGNNQFYWKCICDCGNKFSTYGSALKDMKQVTCGDRTIHCSGENNGNWKGGVSTEYERIRSSKEYGVWRDNILKNDNNQCVICSGVNDLEAHHIYPFSIYVDKRLDVSNGITLCVKHHSLKYPGSFHNIYGARNNTPQQLEEYINNKRKELGINIPFNIDEYILSSLTNEEIEFNNHAEETWYFNKHNILKEDIA